MCARVCRCGVSPHVSEATQLSLTIGDLNVPLPSEVKALGTEADRVLTLEELAMKALHVAYSRNRKGETCIHLSCTRLFKAHLKGFRSRSLLVFCCWSLFALRRFLRSLKNNKSKLKTRFTQHFCSIILYITSFDPKANPFSLSINVICKPVF